MSTLLLDDTRVQVHTMGHHIIPTEQINAHCCCFNMRKVNRAVTQFYDEYLDSTGIRITQYTLLVEIASSDSKTLSEIAASLIMDRTTLTRNLKPLQKAGYIANTKTVDKRSKSYVLTDKGRKVVEDATPLWQEAQDKIIRAFGHHEYKALCEELEKLLKVTSAHKNKPPKS